MSIIKSATLNEYFDDTLLDGLSKQNRVPSGTRNIVFSFDMVSLVSDSSSSYDISQDSENLEQIFRIYDDTQVVGVMVDMWGLDRPGLMANDLPQGGGGVSSAAISFGVKILGNYTNLDDEKGYPAVYKSTEFNLVNDFNVTWEDQYANGVPVSVSPIDNWNMSKNFLSGDTVPGRDLSNMFVIERDVPKRQIFYPVGDENGTQILHGGAEYIITLGNVGDSGVVTKDQNDVPALHMTTSIQLTLICRCFRRRFS